MQWSLYHSPLLLYIAYIYKYTHTYIYIYIHVYICMHMYTYIYISLSGCERAWGEERDRLRVLERQRALMKGAPDQRSRLVKTLHLHLYNYVAVIWSALCSPKHCKGFVSPLTFIWHQLPITKWVTYKVGQNHTETRPEKVCMHKEPRIVDQTVCVSVLPAPHTNCASVTVTP